MATDLPELDDVQMHSEDDTSLMGDSVLLTWADGCRVRTTSIPSDEVVVRTWWRDGAEGDQRNLSDEISPARVATRILDAYYAERQTDHMGHTNGTLRVEWPLIHAILTEEGN